MIAAAKFYDEKVIGLGSNFLDEFERGVKLLLERPDRWPVIGDGMWRFLMSRFPYGVYYRIIGDEVRVLVVKHQRQHPDFGMKRQ